MPKKKINNNLWTPTGQGNLIIDKPDLFLSYRGGRDTFSEDWLEAVDLIEDIGNMMGVKGSKTGEETALKIDGVWMILNGDFRDEYEQALEKGGVEECLLVYNKYKDQYRSDWSTDHD